MKPRERFLPLLKHDILKLDLAELNFGVYRILNARRDLVLRILDEELPAFIADQTATLPGTATGDEGLGHARENTSTSAALPFTRTIGSGLSSCPEPSSARVAPLTRMLVPKSLLRA